MKKKTVRLLSGILSFGLLAVLMISLALPSFANSHLPSFEISSVSCQIGDEVEVFLTMKNAAGFQSGDADIYYDNNLLEFIRSESPSITAEAGLIIEAGQNQYNANILSLSFLHMDDLAEEYNEIEILKLVFKAKFSGRGQFRFVPIDIRTAISELDLSKEIQEATAAVEVADEDGVIAGDSVFDGDYGKLLLIGGIVVVAVIGIVVVVTVLTRKKTDVNPNKIDVKKD